MNQSLFRYLALILLLLIGACAPKQDLVQKAFEDKDFGTYVPDDAADDSDGNNEDEEDKGTKTEVLVDNLPQVPRESVFTESGNGDRPMQPPFGEDPQVQGLKFDETPLYEIVQTLLNQLEVNYIIDPVLKDQAITLDIKAGGGGFKASDLLDLVLKLHDLTMVIYENYVHILPIDNPGVNPGLRLLHGTLPNQNLRREELAIQIIPLRFVAPADISNVIKEFLSPSARVYEEPKNNVLVIVDKYQFIAKVMELIPTFDVDVLANKKMVLYQLAFVDATEIASRLEEILAVYGLEADGQRLSIVPIDTLNGILVVSSTANIFDELDFWMEKFDKEAQFEEPQVFIYHVENTTAPNIAETLSQIYDLRTSGGVGGNISAGASQRRTTNPGRNPGGGTNNRLGNNNNRLNNNQQGLPGGNQQGGLNQQNNGLNTGGAAGASRSFNIASSDDPNAPVMVIDEANNSLIFQTTPREYSRILKTLDKLDVLPRQVFLEVTVLSVELRDSFAFGINWNALDDESSNPSSSVDTFSLGFQSGEGSDVTSLSGVYSYTGASGMITATLNALKTKGYANLLQQPHIMAIDNRPATISVGTDIPIATATTNISNIANGGSINPAVSSTIQYRSTGVSLNFTPHINANGVIRLEMALDISAPGSAQGSEAAAVPISQNTLATEMIVRDGQTIIMGGLIFNEESWSKSNVPWLGRIPLLRHLFTDRNSSATKSELVVMITPRLVDSEEKSIQISKEFKEKILKEFESFKNTRN